MTWSEDRLHRWLSRQSAPAIVRGRMGHDAAVLPVSQGRSVQCADQCVAGVHFDSSASPKAVGRKVVMRTLSDLAATGARPLAVLLTVTAGPEIEEKWLRMVIRGASEAAQEFGAGLVGGDLAMAGSGVVLAAFAHGELEGTRRPVARDRAKPGQTILITGPVGGSLLGRHLRILPAIQVGRELFAAGATAMMDVSDGLAWDLHRMSRSSGVRFELDRVPIHRDARRMARQSGRSALDHALHDGEDHVLVACTSLNTWPADCTPLCQVVPGKGLWLGSELFRGSDAPTDVSPSVKKRGRLWRPGEGGWSHGPKG
jgi:thiamine-monophosphate kinase